jgi:hypothetical protein
MDKKVNNSSKFHKNLKELVKVNLISELEKVGRNTYSFTLVNQQEISGEDVSMINFSDFRVQVTDNGVEHPDFKMTFPQVNWNCPHVYKPSGKLCLYHPSEFVWNKDMIGRRLILVLYSWVTYYYIWERTGKWYGKEYQH